MFGLTHAVFLVGSGQPIYYPAVVIDTHMSRGKGGTSYYAVVRLFSGKEAQLNVSHAVYQRISQGEELVVCDYESLFGTGFVRLHAPD